MDIICDSLHIIMSGLKYVDILMAFVFQDCINNKYHKCLPLGVPWGTLNIETNWGHLGDPGIGDYDYTTELFWDYDKP